jgi:hypothetical protein
MWILGSGKPEYPDFWWGRPMKIIQNNYLRASLMSLIVLVGGLSFANHLNSVEEDDLDDGGIRKSKSWKTNLFVYKSIGGETTVKGKEKKRKWWCVWLCKRRVDKNAELIVIQNTYFSEISPGVFSNAQKAPKQCQDSSSCKQSEWAVGGAIKIPFPGGGTIDNLLPIDGVITRHEIMVDGQTFVEMTAKGKHPEPDGPIIQ